MRAGEQKVLVPDTSHTITAASSEREGHVEVGHFLGGGMYLYI